ncbi:hypothetical protein [Sebaldella sp. S0638]|uniref:hypothetical protein n=1 Tax=Sebaldella sp. S0638 TaxID=2957809 RepID=UPI0020A0CA9E|nr:hypothetical protein [Sebaldella sp. S0638]MCP1223186.1 hypothetical protein [Sebaldella sp. S0638]
MKEKFSEEYNLILQLNYRKKSICENLFSNFRIAHHSLHNLLLKEYLKPDIYDLIEPSTFKKKIEEYYDEQQIIADTIHVLTDPSTFEESIEEYYEIQKCIIDNAHDFSETSTFNEKNIEKNVQELIDPLSYNDTNYLRQMEEERIIRNTTKIFSHSFFKTINKIFNNIYFTEGNIKITVNKNMVLNVSREKFYEVYERIKDQSSFNSIEKIEITSLFCIVYELSTIYCVLNDKAVLDLQKFIVEFQILVHFYVKNISPEVFSFFKDPRKVDIIMHRHSAPLIFWFLLKFVIRNFPKWG